MNQYRAGYALALFIVASVALAQPAERWFIDRDAALPVDPQTKAEIFKAACVDGKIEGDTCSKCPDEGEGFWSISTIIAGHFSAPKSEEALVKSIGCSYVGRENGFGLLLGKREGKWITLEVVGSEDTCMRRKQRSGREFLICESWEYHRDGELSYWLGTVMVENEMLKVQELFTASDSTAACFVSGTAQKVEVQDVKFADVNGDGLEDISITATHGTFEMNEHRQQQCEAASDERMRLTDGAKPVKKYPQPGSMKKYKIQFLFDGDTYTLTPESQAAAAIFQS
jgi:hypothetical protein